MTLSAWEKRVRRHVSGPGHEFFAATSPELADICREELAHLFPDIADIAATPGGVGFSGRLLDLYRANLELTFTNRVLMRVARFSAESFAEFSAGAENVAWELYFSPEAELSIHVTTMKCRLHHTDALAERLIQAISRRRIARAEKGAETAGSAGDPRPQQAIFVRGVSDVFELSLDSSGELLHKRGLTHEVGRAPLRSTIAAAVLALSGYDPEKPLIDPMAGAGSFCIEACLRAKNIPAGWFRSFSFMDWPAFSQASFAHMRKKREEGFINLAAPRIFSSDINLQAIENLSGLIEKAGMADAARVQASDFFLLDPKEACGEEKGLVVINPPYGRRLSSPEGAELLFFRIAQRLAECYEGFRVAMLCPRKGWVKMLSSLSWRNGPETFLLRHGGLIVTLVTGELR